MCVAAVERENILMQFRLYLDYIGT